MIKAIDNFLNNITMYRLVLYYLLVLVILASFFGFLGILPYSFFSIIFSAVLITLVMLTANEIFARTYGAPTNSESVYISALILTLIITPPKNLHDIMFLFWAAVWTAASKFIFAINKKHLFNPVALSVFLLSITLGTAATWWVGRSVLLPFVFIGGVLIVRKIKRFDMVGSFFLASMVTIGFFSYQAGANLFSTFSKTLLASPWIFFAFVMLTEPLTTPPTKSLQIIYGSLVGILFSPQFHLFSFYTTPEMALLIGNIYSYIASPKYKLLLSLQEKIQIAPDIYDFIFRPSQKLAFSPGQYMEWTLPHQKPDARGNRRYFTLASSPTEENLRIGVKFYQEASSYKMNLFYGNEKKTIVASQLAGDFTLPDKEGQKYVFIAGGIGITPFRSMIKYMLDKNQKRPVVLFYSNRHFNEIIYREVFSQAERQLGIKVIYTLTDLSSVPENWTGKTGRINRDLIAQEVPDYRKRLFYLSGPKKMIDAFKRVLKKMGVSQNQIKTDYFPGFV